MLCVGKNLSPSHLLDRRKSEPFRVPIFRPPNPISFIPLLCDTRYYCYVVIIILSLLRYFLRWCRGLWWVLYWFRNEKTIARILSTALNLRWWMLKTREMELLWKNNVILWTPANIPSRRSDQRMYSNTLDSTCTVPVYKLICNCK